MGLIDIFKTLSTVRGSVVNEFQQHQEINSWDCRKSSLGPLGAMGGCCLLCYAVPDDFIVRGHLSCMYIFRYFSDLLLGIFFSKASFIESPNPILTYVSNKPVNAFNHPVAWFFSTIFYFLQCFLNSVWKISMSLAVHEIIIVGPMIIIRSRKIYYN